MARSAAIKHDLGYNLLRTEVFLAWLTNAEFFVSSESGAQHVLHFTAVQQNTATDVFDVQPDGRLLIRKPGVVSVSASLSIVTLGHITADMSIYVNGSAPTRSRMGPTDPTSSLPPSSLTSNLTWKVAADDAITVRSTPHPIVRFDTGLPGTTDPDSYKYMSVQWTGVG